MTEASVYVSASQLKNAFDPTSGCLRKWGFDKINQIRQPESTAMAFGTAGHTQCEGWLRTGRKPDQTDPGRAAAQGIKKGFLPMPGPHLMIEEKFEHFIAPGVRVIGYIDCVVPPDPLRPMVIDHKFTSDLRYMMTAAELLVDAQAQIYAWYARKKFKVEEVDVKWIYYCASGRVKRTPKGCKKVEATIRETPRWNQIVEQSVQLSEYRRTVDDANELEANTTACSAYGGCYYGPGKLGICKAAGDRPSLGARLKQWNKTSEVKASAIPTKEKDMAKSLMEKLREKKPSKGINPPKKKKRKVTAKAPEVVSFIEEEVDPDITKVSEPKPEKKKDAAVKPQFIVCFDCSSFKGTFGVPELHLVEFLRPIMSRVATAYNVEHWGLIEYGRANAALATALDKAIHDGITPCVLLVDSTTNEGRAVKETLIHYADLVIRGSR